MKLTYLKISLIVYVSSLIFPAYYMGALHTPENAFVILLIGWMATIDGYVTWFANPLYVLSLIIYRYKPKFSLACMIIALGIALSFMLHSQIIVSAAPRYEMITGYGLGYWLWLCSFVIFIIGQLKYLNTLKDTGPKGD